MLQVTIKVELNALDKAETEVNALLVYINELKKTYAPELAKEPEPKPTRKPRATKKAEPKQEPVKAEKTEPEPTSKPEPTKNEGVTAQDLIALARDTVKRGVDRKLVKDIIAEYGVSKIDSIPEDKREEFAEKVKAL